MSTPEKTDKPKPYAALENPFLKTLEARLLEVIDDIEGETWKLHERLGQGYNHRWEQVEDMRRLGNMGEAAVKAMDAVQAIRRAYKPVELW